MLDMVSRGVFHLGFDMSFPGDDTLSIILLLLS